MPHAEASPDDHRLAAELATEAGELLVDLRAELVAVGRRSRRAQGRGRPRSHTSSSWSGWPTCTRRRRPVRGGQGRAGRRRHLSARRRAGVGRRPARRHPRVLRAAPGRLGRPRGPGRSTASRSPGRWRCRPSTSRSDRPAPADAARRRRPSPGSSSAGPGRRPSPPPWPPSWAPRWSRWARPAPRRGGDHGRGRRLRPLRRPVRVGLVRAGRGGARPPASTPPGSTARRSSTTTPTPTSPTCSSATRRSPKPGQGRAERMRASASARARSDMSAEDPGDDDGTVVARGPGLERVDRGL